jgi:hypothetical protein
LLYRASCAFAAMSFGPLSFAAADFLLVVHLTILKNRLSSAGLRCNAIITAKTKLKGRAAQAQRMAGIVAYLARVEDQHHGLVVCCVGAVTVIHDTACQVISGRSTSHVELCLVRYASTQMLHQ